MNRLAPEPAAQGGTWCPVARAQQIIGDRWTVLVLRELFFGSRRFDAIQAHSQATPQMLTIRLK
jgi:DNA-binding HxlR family transcriptional regulator